MGARLNRLSIKDLALVQMLTVQQKIRLVSVKMLILVQPMATLKLPTQAIMELALGLSQWSRLDLPQVEIQ